MPFSVDVHRAADSDQVYRRDGSWCTDHDASITHEQLQAFHVAHVSGLRFGVGTEGAEMIGRLDAGHKELKLSDYNFGLISKKNKKSKGCRRGMDATGRGYQNL